MQITRDFLFVNLRKKLTSLTSRFRQVSCRYVWHYMMKVNCRLSVWQKPKDFFSQITVSYENDITKDSEAKPFEKNRHHSKPNRTEPKEIRLKLGIVCYWKQFCFGVLKYAAVLMECVFTWYTLGVCAFVWYSNHHCSDKVMVWWSKKERKLYIILAAEIYFIPRKNVSTESHYFLHSYCRHTIRIIWPTTPIF